ncbi:MAG: peptidylprolyl isomerase [Lentisphaeria bacterium]|nr:peptidylprolyl isomerase [Lentisphaeria bacterium]
MKLAVYLLLFALMTSVPVMAQDLGKETRIDSVLASVNGDPVTLLDVLLETSREELRLASLYTGARLYSEIAKLRQSVVEDIILRKLVYSQYEKKPFPIDNQYIESMLDFYAMTIGNGSREGLLKKINEMGTTLGELRRKVKEKIAVDILLMDACDRPVYITPKEVYEEYEKNQKRWTTPASYNLELLQIAKNNSRSGADVTKSCQEIKKQLEKADAKRFEQLVKSTSDAPNASTGGKIGNVDADKLRPEFVVVTKMKTGEICGPVETPEGFYFIRLAGITAEKKIPFEKASSEIRTNLEKEAKARMRKAYAEKIKKEALIRYYF